MIFARLCNLNQKVWLESLSEADQQRLIAYSSPGAGYPYGCRSLIT